MEALSSSTGGRSKHSAESAWDREICVITRNDCTVLSQLHILAYEYVDDVQEFAYSCPEIWRSRKGNSFNKPTYLHI